MAPRSESSIRRSRRHYEVYITRSEDLSQSDPIEEREWLDLVAGHDDLYAVDPADYSGSNEWRQTWKFRSYPEGTPLFFANGAIHIVRDDSETIERMLPLAEALGARVVAEDGEVFSAQGTPVEAESIQPARSRRPRIILNDERIRRRQILLFLPVCLIYPVLVVYWAMTGTVGIFHYVLAAASLALGAYAARGLLRHRYFIERDSLGSRWLVHDRDRRSTSPEVITTEYKSRDLSGLELVWFVLKYPSRTKVQFHVRGAGQPSLVLLETGSERAAKKTLKEASRELALRAIDRTDEAQAKDIPKEYQLTAAEKKAVPLGKQLLVVVVMLLVAGGINAAGGRIAAYVIAGLAGLLLIGNVAGRFMPDAIPDKYRDRI